MAIDLDQMIRDADPARELSITPPDPSIARTALHRRPARRRWITAGVLTPALSALVVVAVVAVVLLAGGRRGTPGPVPAAPPPTTGMILMQTPDPVGGLPWGLDLVKGSGGRVCMQVGRVHNNRLGAIGRYGANGNDNAFHPLVKTDHGPGIESCATPDADGNVFYTVLVPSTSASGDHHVKGSSAADRRTLEYGLYGPDVKSVTYVGAHGRLVTRPAGPGGSFLVVLPQTPKICRPGQSTCITLRSGAGIGVISGPITTVRYRDGSACHLVNHETSMCPAQGRVFAPVKPVAPVVPRREVASTVTAQPLPALYYCEPRNKLAEWTPCEHGTPPGDMRTNGTGGTGIHEEIVQISFTARLASGPRRQYEMSYANPCDGGGGGGPATAGAVTAGQHITLRTFFPLRCHKRYTGRITYGPQGAAPVTASLSGSVVVGRFSFTIPKN